MKKLLVGRNKEVNKFDIDYYKKEKKEGDSKEFWYKSSSATEDVIIHNIKLENSKKDNTTSSVYMTTSKSDRTKLEDVDLIPVSVVDGNLKSRANETDEDNIQKLDVTI